MVLREVELRKKSIESRCLVGGELRTVPLALMTDGPAR